MHPLVFLALRSAQNGLRVRLRRLKQPKYALGALFALVYLGSYFGCVASGAFVGAAPRPSDGSAAPFLVDLGALLLFAWIALGCWVASGSRAAIALSETEAAWFFSMPLRRVVVLRYKLASQLGSRLFFALFFLLVSGRLGLGLGPLRGLLGAWLLFAFTFLHGVAASFALDRLARRGLPPLVPRLLALGLFLGVGARLLARFDASTTSDASPLAVLASMHDALHQGLLGAVLAPFRWVVAPLFARDGLELARLALPVLGLLAAHIFLIERADVAFEEGSIELARVRAERLAAMRAGKPVFARGKPRHRLPAFSLAGPGHPLVAYLWRGLLQAGGRTTLRNSALGVLLLGLLAVPLIETRGAPVRALLALPAYLALLVAVLGGGARAAQELRSGAQAGGLARLLPLPSWQIVLGETLAGLVPPIGVIVAALFLGTIAMHGVVPDAAPIALGLALVLPLVSMLLGCLTIGTVLLFPAWFRDPSARPGLDVVGLRLLSMLGFLLVLVGYGIPVALVGGGLALLASAVTEGPPVILAGSLGVAMVLAAELALTAYGVGRIFEGYDPSEA